MLETDERERTADDRGRVNLGPEFSGADVDVVVVRKDDGSLIAHVTSDGEKAAN